MTTIVTRIIQWWYGENSENTAPDRISDGVDLDEMNKPPISMSEGSTENQNSQYTPPPDQSDIILRHLRVLEHRNRLLDESDLKQQAAQRSLYTLVYPNRPPDQSGIMHQSIPELIRTLEKAKKQRDLNALKHQYVMSRPPPQNRIFTA